MGTPVSTLEANPEVEDVPGRRNNDHEVTAARDAQVGDLAVRRLLPLRTRRSVGAWCFIDHYGPADTDGRGGMNVPPHPHIGLQTVTWLLRGNVLHRDSLGSEQLIRPGQLNLMTSGRGIAHAEQTVIPPSAADRDPVLHGVQLWVALPDASRHVAPAFEHHAAVPQTSLPAASACGSPSRYSWANSRAPGRPLPRSPRSLAPNWPRRKISGQPVRCRCGPTSST